MMMKQFIHEINMQDSQQGSSQAMRDVSSTINISGLRLVTRIWGGIELPPGARKPGKSEYKRIPGA